MYMNSRKEMEKEFELYNDDCRDILRTIDSNSIDLVITDRPITPAFLTFCDNEVSSQLSPIPSMK